MKALTKLSLKKKLIFSLMGLVLISNLSLAGFTYFKMRNYIDESVQRDLSNRVLRKKDLITSYYVSYSKQITETKLIIQDFFSKELDLTDEILKAKVKNITKLTNTGIRVFVEKNGKFELKYSSNSIFSDEPFFETSVKNPLLPIINDKNYIISSIDIHDQTNHDFMFEITMALPSLTKIRDEIKKTSYGETGYSYIADPKGKLIAHKSIQGKNILNLKDADGEYFLKEMFKKKEGIHYYNWLAPGAKDAVKKTVAFDTIPNLGWLLVSGQDHDEMYAPLYRIKIAFVVILVAVILVSFLITIAVQKNITSPVQAAADILTKLSHKLETSSNKVLSSSQNLSERTSSQAASITETANQIDYIKSSIKNSNHTIQETNEVASRSVDSANQGRERVDEMIQSISDIETSNINVMSKVEENGKKLEEVTNVISEIAQKTQVINDIVFQTKLLSFNASVEAARAGENGKGFAVVAEEVGNLARLSGNSATEIQTLLDRGINRVDEIVIENKAEMEKIIQQNKSRIENGVQVARSCQSSLDTIVSDISSTGETIHGILETSETQLSSISEINIAIDMLNDITHENIGVSQQSSHDAKEMRNDSELLKQVTSELLQTIHGA